MASRDIPFLVQLLRMCIKIIVGGVLIIALFVAAGSFFGGADKEAAVPGAHKYGYVHGSKDSLNRLLRLEITGPILGSPPDQFSDPFGFFGPVGLTFGYELKRALEEAAKDDSVKGIFLHISTPGGTIFGSMAISEGIKAYQEATGKPVVAYIEGMSASGGVMAMVDSDAIYADSGSFIGSIGVIGGEIYYYDGPRALHGGLLGGGVTTLNGIEQTMITAGRGKDLGNPFRRITPEEKEGLQAAVDHLYKDFVAHVSEARHMDQDFIVDTMGAHIFSNYEAEEYGLIDGTKSWDGALQDLAERAGVSDDYVLVRLKAGDGGGLFGMLGSTFLGKQREAAKAQFQASVDSLLCSTARSQALVYYGYPGNLCPSSK